MILPNRIEVQLVAPLGASAHDLLVALDLRYDGRYYFGTLVGLTDSAGYVCISREEIERAFKEDQRLFPMYYRVPLSECDAEAIVRVEGGREFMRRRTELDYPFISAETRAVWQRARNERIGSTSANVTFPSISDAACQVQLSVVNA